MSKPDLFIGDLHFGEKGNSPKYNQQLLTFIDWVIENYDGKVNRIIQLGDYFHNRSKIQIDTLNYGIKGAQKLSEAFGRDKVFVLAGNHDLYYETRLDTSSLAAIAPYITLIDEITDLEDLVLTPWVVNGEQWDAVVDRARKDTVLCGHFEFNGFKMNDHYVMQHGRSHKALKNYGMVFSGHYHSFQKKDNVVYTGTPLPITMNEANEPHFVFLVDPNGPKDYEKVQYDKVKVISIPYDQLPDIIETLDPENTSIRIEFPDDLEDESLIEDVRDILNEYNFDDQKIKYRGKRAKELVESDADQISNVENIDESVLYAIDNSAPVVGVDKNELISLYKEAQNRKEADE